MSNRCFVCQFVERNECFPDGTSHCDDCHRTWTALEELHCTICHHQFGSDRAFLDAHRGGQCHDPATLPKKLRAVRRQHGLVWVRKDDRPIPQKARRSVGSRPGAANSPSSGSPRQEALACV